MKQTLSPLFVVPLFVGRAVSGFAPNSPLSFQHKTNGVNNAKYPETLHPIRGVVLKATEDDKVVKRVGDDQSSRSISAAPLQNDRIEIDLPSTPQTTEENSAAKTNTVNERLMAELQAATDAERGPKTKMGERFKNSFRYTEKTDEERELALEQARDLNGVNPTVTILASFFAFGMAYGLWSLTQFLAELFLTHPMSPDAPYAFTRIASVFRNAIMGLTSLASGFSLVSGLGVFLLGVRVAYGEYSEAKINMLVDLKCVSQIHFFGANYT